MGRFSKFLSALFMVMIVAGLCGCKVKRFSKADDVVPAPASVPAPLPVKVSSAPVTAKKKCIIVCTPDFMRAAKTFSYLHREYEGVASVIIKIPYTNGTIESRTKIVSGIKKLVTAQNKSGQVMSVLILGNRNIVPLADFSVEGDTKLYVSDYGYAGTADSPENMPVVGRIPARTGDEAEVVAAKYERWYEDRQFRPAWPVSFIGGDGFSGESFSDPELLFFKLQQEGIAGPEAIRYLGAAGGCKAQRLKQSLAEDDVSIQWLALDARQNGFRVGRDFLALSEIIELEYKPGLPVILNPSCEAVPLNSTIPTPAEALVLAEGGGLAVLTGCSTSGKLSAELDRGRVFRVDSSGMNRLLMEFHKAYFSGKHRIAEALSEARAQFAENLRPGESLSPLYDLIFYGDPVMSLPLPVRTESPSYNGLVTVTKPAARNGVAVYPVNATVSFAMEEGGVYPSVDLQVIDRNTGKSVSRLKVSEEDIFNFSSDGEGSYLIYSRPLDGPLAWQFFDIRENPGEGPGIVKVSSKKKTVKPNITAGLEPVRYSVQVSSNREKKSAVKVRKRLRREGYDAYVVEVTSANRRKWYCVRFGSYDSWADAVEASAAYERDKQADAKIVRCK